MLQDPPDLTLCALRRALPRAAAPLFLTALMLSACGCGEDPANADEVQPSPAASSPSAASPSDRTPARVDWEESGCARTECHGGIEPIRAFETEMMAEILELGAEHGDPNGCVVCHGGSPDAPTAEEAHQGSPTSLSEAGGAETFYEDPGSPWVNGRTCGLCHQAHVAAQWTSLMMTEAGKIQGSEWGFGLAEDYTHRHGNHAVENPDEAHARLGTPAYREYMRLKRDAHPEVYPDALDALPEAPTEEELSDLAEDPGRAAYTYVRAECNRCHLGVRGRSRRGDYRAMGCGACHIPYGNEGLYEGDDEALPADEPGHPLVHQIQGGRGAVVSVHGESYTGIPVETCTTCHNRGKRVGVSYQGLMESAYGSPLTEGGGGQLDLHSKHYMQLEQDAHYRAGMLCQDCHTSIDVHGDAFLAGTNLAAIEIECSDCHGTPSAYPWELPLGWGDEDAPGAAEGAARGVARELPEPLDQGTVFPPEDGYLLSARGNPMPEVVRRGDEVEVHTASGRDLHLVPLRALSERGELSREAQVAMVNVASHMERMECYSCHSSWAPQCYGCHIEIDFSEESRSFDWVAASQRHASEENSADGSEAGYDVMIPGAVTETRSYLRWEDPPLGVNGEGRVTPLIPGCQTTVTIIGPDGEEIVRNRIFRTAPHLEGGGEEGQLAIDMSPVQPHTTGRSRSCESCHASARALGHGVDPGALGRDWSAPAVIDLTTADGRVLPRSARPQVEAIEGLEMDWSVLVDETGRQRQTVGHHFEGSGPLDDATRARMDRANVCVGCHIEIPAGDLAVEALHHAAEMTSQLPEAREAHEGLLHKLTLTTAWVQVGAAFAFGALSAALLLRLGLRRRRHGP